MYNSIYPININYRKHNQFNSPKPDAENPDTSVVSEESKKQNTFPNGAKVAIDYTKGQINISQVLMDFRNTILAINAPDDVRQEVSDYLNLVEKESHKENPSRDIIIANLKNASKISDAFITKSLKKTSNVVEGWIDALFLQKINLKADPDEINPDFLLEFPQSAKEKIEKEKPSSFVLTPSGKTDTVSIKNSSVSAIDVDDNLPDIAETSTANDFQVINDEDIEIENEFEIDEEHDLNSSQAVSPSPYAPLSDADIKARELYISAKNMPQTNQGDTDALNFLNEALGILSDSDSSNENIKAAIHFERGKIFDDYDYVDFALKDYWQATKAQELNLKSQAFFRSASIYDEFGEFSPALNNYLSAVAYSGEAENPNIQSKALSSIAGLYAKQFDSESTAEYSELAIDVAVDSNNENLIANTYSNSAQNFQYIGDNEKALNGYKNALKIFSNTQESYEQIAYNYEQASLVMAKLGNQAKARKLQAKANLYYQKAQLQEGQLEAVS